MSVPVDRYSDSQIASETRRQRPLMFLFTNVRNGIPKLTGAHMRLAHAQAHVTESSTIRRKHLEEFLFLMQFGVCSRSQQVAVV